MPATIGKYRIERQLGKGASGTVYLAYDGFRAMHVAIKQLHAHLFVDSTQAARYRRILHNEAALTGRLNHPYIVGIIDVDEEATPPHLVLEYIQGRSLENYVRADALLPVSEVLDIAFKCCNALEYAQTIGLVHRDIKPANLLLRDDGELKLTDFGIAVSQQGEETHAVGLMGSPCYMSPEQIREEAVTHHSDMFSLGVVIYELLTGQKPFQGDTDFTTIYKICADPSPSLRMLRPELSTKLDIVISRALSKRPTDRFATWREFADALMESNRGQPSMASQSIEAVRFQLLRSMEFSKDFSDVALWETLRLGKMHRLDKGEVLMREGATGSSFYILLQGSVEVTRNEHPLCKLSSGVSIGEMVYLQPEKKVRSATVVAQTDIVVLKIQEQSLRLSSAELQGAFDKAFLRVLVNRLIATNRQLAEWDADW